MLDLIYKLFEKFNSSQIRYCHWKSNAFLNEALNGEGDLDILVDEADKDKCVSIMKELFFIKFHDSFFSFSDLVCHYYGLDEKSGRIVHVHLYYQIITGGTLCKEYHLEIEEMLFQNIRHDGLVKVPSKAAELLLLTIRAVLKQGLHITAIIFARKERPCIKKEFNWLADENAVAKAIDLSRKWLPSVTSEFIAQCIESMHSPHRFAVLERAVLNRRMKISLSGYLRYSYLKTYVCSHFLLGKQAYRKLRGGKKWKTPYDGRGAVVAFIGPEATGKSTLAEEINQWLSKNLLVYDVHAGKPPSTIFTFLPNSIMPVLRKISGGLRTSKLDHKQQNIGSRRLGFSASLIYSLRALMVAIDRLFLLKRVSRMAAKGAIIICDRYPVNIIGAMDSPRLDHARLYNLPFFCKLAEAERWIYAQIPPPAIVFSLTVSPEIAVKRNENRIKKGKEDAEYVRSRHLQSEKLHYAGKNAHELNTDEGLSDTILKVKKVFWEDMVLAKNHKKGI